MPDRHPPLTIDRRYCGPPTSANGGYFAGRLAAYLDPVAPVVVTLRQPPPLDAQVDVADTADGGVRATFGGALVADARRCDDDLDPVESVELATAEAAAKGYLGDLAHPFPTCFSCGPARSVPDALGLRPGPVPGLDHTTAAPWTPSPVIATDAGRVPPELVWAALDCPGGWTLDLVGRPAVLGRITAVVDALPEAGEPCVVTGRLVSKEGRKARALTTLYDGDGRVLARASSVWIEVDPAALRP
jgi:hypothetical protein